MQRPYILLTAAKNEEDYIGEAIESVLKQSVHPIVWFIMDDGSTDGTSEIVKGFAVRNQFIRLHSAGEGKERNFGSQYKAIQAAYDLARPLDFEFFGVHDADIAPERADYYESMLDEFHQDSRLGIVGGYIYERSNGAWRCRDGNSSDSVAGGIQMFRRACFEQIGGYRALYLGGSDWLAQIDAKISGWKVLACTDFPVRHYRLTSGANGLLRGWFRQGQLAASFGSHPVFEFVKCARRSAFFPILVGAVARLAGYFWWKCGGHKPVIPPEKVSFLRRQQWEKMTSYLSLAGKYPHM